MAVKIRLSRIGKKHAPFYRVVAVDGRKKRDGAFLEDLGTYDTLKGVWITIKSDRVDHWLSVGAVPTDSFKKLHKDYTRSTKTTEVKAEAAPKAAKKATSSKKTTSTKAE